MILVIGDDRFGQYHARQLLKAGLPVTTAGPEGLGAWLQDAGLEDHLVPHPLMPHLLWDWLAGAVSAERGTAPRQWGLPYEAVGGDGALYLSAAGWVCPSACVEPAHCPVLHAPRDWDLGDLIEARAREEGYEPAVFRCLHFAAGVGTVPVAAIREARDRVAKALDQRPALVATSSRCHAAVGTLAPSRTG